VIATAAAGARQSFSAVDTAPDATSLIAALDQQSSIPAVQRLRAVAFDLLDVRQGARVIDAGCGTGDVARAIAALVGTGGAVVGIDASDTMVNEARRRVGARGLLVDFRRDDITAITDGDGTYDAAICERVLQHLAHPDRALRELVRVVRPGGRIVVIDTDWGMHAIHGASPAVTDRIVAAWRGRAVHGLCGRALPALFADVGIADVSVVAETLTSRDPRYPGQEPFAAMAAHAEQCGVIGEEVGGEWLEQLAEAGRDGRFFWALTMFAVGGATPRTCAQ
jgi:ubiquinone/menaquinone biosynthesis C-methylase UbiE